MAPEPIWQDYKEEEVQRTGSNRLFMILYLLFYCAITAIFLIIAFAEITPPQGTAWMKWSVVFGLILFLVGTPILMSRSFPRNNRKASRLLLPYFLNAIYFFVIKPSSATVVDTLILESIVAYEGVILGLFLSSLLQPWVGEPPTADGKRSVLKGFRYKLEYVKREPAVLIGFGVLLIPVLSVVYFLIVGGNMHRGLSAGLPSWAATSLYLLTILNVAFFHYKEIRKNF